MFSKGSEVGNTAYDYFHMHGHVTHRQCFDLSLDLHLELLSRLHLDTDVIDTALETYAVNFSIGEGLAGTLGFILRTISFRQ